MCRGIFTHCKMAGFGELHRKFCMSALRVADIGDLVSGSWTLSSVVVMDNASYHSVRIKCWKELIIDPCSENVPIHFAVIVPTVIVFALEDKLTVGQKSVLSSGVLDAHAVYSGQQPSYTRPCVG